MDRLDFTQNTLNAGLPGGKKTDIRKSRNKTDAGRRVFSDVMERSIFETQDLGPLPSSSDLTDEAKQILLDDVRSAGDSLRRRPLPQEMLDYKKAVRNFLHYVVENSYEIQTSEGMKRKVYIRGEKRWDARAYHQVKIVDQKLEELAAGILLKQINDLDLKTKLEEITGLLVDLKVTGKISVEN